MDMLTVKSLNKTYDGQVQTRALSDISLNVAKGEFVGIMGPSGSGKTTLLNLVSTIDVPTSGDVVIDGVNPYQLRPTQLASFRRRQLGFVFQDFNLLDTLTVAENIVLPLTLDRQNLRLMDTKLQKLAQRLGIEEILHKRTYEISGGQKQRAAIARAIINSPSLLLADEPTGALDSNSSRIVMEMMETINRVDETTMLLVSHDPVAASYCHRVVFIKDGRLDHEIKRGDNREQFFNRIMDSLSLTGRESS